VLNSANVDVRSQTPLASVAVAVAVKKGSPKPDISSVDAVRRMLLSAKSVAYPNAAGGAAAGVSFEATLKQLGIADQVESKSSALKVERGRWRWWLMGELRSGLPS
jgi:molybdate transport system substrate-binding protein